MQVKNQANIDSAITHELTHLWWDEDIPDPWIYEGVATYFETLTADQLGYPLEQAIGTFELGLLIETQVRDHNFPQGNIAHRYDIGYGVYTQAYSAQYYFGALLAHHLQQRIGRTRNLKFFRELRQNNKSQDITTRLFLQNLHDQLPEVYEEFQTLLNSSPTASLSLNKTFNLNEARLALDSVNLLARMQALLTLRNAPQEIAWELGQGFLKEKNSLLQAAAVVGLANHAKSDSELKQLLEPFRNLDMDYVIYKTMAFGAAHSRNSLLYSGFANLVSKNIPFRNRWAIAYALALLHNEEHIQILFSTFPEDKFTLIGALNEAPDLTAAREYLLKVAQDAKERLFYRLMALLGLAQARVVLKRPILEELLSKIKEERQQNIILEYLNQAHPPYTCELLRSPLWKRKDPVLETKWNQIQGLCN